MKFSIAGQPKREFKMVLSLEPESDGGVKVCGRDEGGTRWNLFAFKVGIDKMVRYGGVPDSIGFSVTPNGEVKVSND